MGFTHKCFNKKNITFQKRIICQKNYCFSHIYAHLNENFIETFFVKTNEWNFHMELKWCIIQYALLEKTSFFEKTFIT
jgi:hypothetical protein